MTAEEKKVMKGLLRQWGSLSREIREQSDELDRFKKACSEIERAQNEGCGCEIVSIESLRKKADSLGSSINRRMNLKTELDGVIGTLPCNMQEVLYTRYVKKIAWEYVPINLPVYMSERHCYRLHQMALELLLKKLRYRRRACDFDGEHIELIG